MAPRVAAAQVAKDVDLPKFDPSFAGDRFFGVPSPFAASDGPINVHGGVLLDYAHNPLVIASDDDSPLSCGDSECSLVEHQLFLHLNVTGTLFDRLAINVDMPFALYQAGEGQVGAGGDTFESPDGSALGDLRIGARVRLFGEYHDPVQLAVAGHLWVPTGTGDAYVSDGAVRGEPHAIIGGRADRFIWTVKAGTLLRGTTRLANVSSGHQFTWGAGLGGLLLEDRTLQLGVETTGAVSFEDTVVRNTNAEAQAGIKYRFVRFLEAGLAAGPGFTSGIGTPDVRALFSLQYTPEPEKPSLDADGDGILDTADACPKVPGVASSDPTKHGCPPPSDRDKDGILDSADACIDIPGKANSDPKQNGCPEKAPEPIVVADRDKDGIADDVDACPDTPGVANSDPKQNGCPPDTDGDGIRDDEDACPKDKGEPNADRAKHGCPKVIFTETEIVILEQVQFDTARATIKKVSDPLLDAVAKVLADHPEILKLEVQGHTDSRGSRPANMALSDARAKAVLDALGKRGIDKKRLVSKGYGPDKPLDTESNEAAWQKNRRVQFVVLEKRPSSTSVQTK